MSHAYQPLPQRPGIWCWFELMTHDPEAAARFYSELFGWAQRTDPMPGGDGSYTTVSDANGAIAGVFSLQKAQMPEGVPPHWTVYNQVQSADAAAERARELGGEVMHGPFDVATMGRMAVLCDPEGAAFQVWEPKAMTGTRLDYRHAGRVCWVELFSRDRERAASFYRALFDWTVEKKDGGYWTYAHEGTGLGGMLDITPPQFEGVPARWAVYFAVDDVDASLAEVKRLGGAVHMPPQDLPGVGRFAVVADPQGADFTLFRLDDAH